MLNLYFNVFSTVQTIHTARGTRKKQSAEAAVAICFTEEKKKNLHVSRLNQSFNLTGRHKKSAPYYTDTQTTHAYERSH